MWHTDKLQVTEVNVPIKNLPPELEGYTILHLTDLHSAWFGQGQEELFQAIEGVNIDMVAITGDVIDRHKRDIKPGIAMIEKASGIAPVYFMPGNHEKASGEVYNELKKEMRKYRVNVLEGKSERTGGISLVGAGAGYSELLNNKDGIVIMLAHYPNVFPKVAGEGVDLVLAGHTHGGQIRLPWVGALYVPGQGKFPKYDAGLFYDRGTYMYVNRGLGTSEIPVRFLCPPEIAVLTLIKE